MCNTIWSALAHLAGGKTAMLERSDYCLGNGVSLTVGRWHSGEVELAQYCRIHQRHL